MTIVTRRASLRANSFNPETRTFAAVAATSTPVSRFDWMSGRMVDEVLTISTDAIDLSRFHSGRAPVLDSHQNFSARDQIGVIRGAKIESGQLLVDVQLSKREDITDLANDIASGVVGNISIGYKILDREIIAGERGGRDKVIVKKWEPVEVSIVPIGADRNAQIRAERTNMPDELEPEDALDERGAAMDDTPPPIKAPKRRSPRVSPKKRREHFCALARRFDLSEDFADRHIALRTSDLDYRAAILNELARSDAETPIFGQVGVGASHDAPDEIERAISDAIYGRMTGRAIEGQGREFMGRSLLDMGAALLQARGDRPAFWNKNELADQILKRDIGVGLHGTGDFPNLLTGAGHRVLLEAHQAAASPLKAIARRRDAADFRAITMLRLSEPPSLEKVNEHGEITRGTRSEVKEGFKLTTYARIFGLTRQAIINDDLGAFSDTMTAWGRAAAEREAAEFVELFVANGGDGIKLDDDTAIYGTGATRGNKAAVGTVIDVANLGKARQSMRERKGLDGVTPIGITPRHLVVGPAKETEAEQVLAAIAAAQVSSANPFSGKLTLHVEPRFAGNAWRLFADLSELPVIEYAYLSGADGPQLSQREGWDVLGVEFRCVLDFGCGISDWRGTHLNPGN